MYWWTFATPTPFACRTVKENCACCAGMVTWWCFRAEPFSLLSGSAVPSRIPSPAPSVAGSVTSSSGSLRFRRPLISPARLNLKGQKLLLFPSQNEALLTPSGSEEHTHSDSNIFAPELPSFPRKNLMERGVPGRLPVLHSWQGICGKELVCKHSPAISRPQ